MAEQRRRQPATGRDTFSVVFTALIVLLAITAAGQMRGAPPFLSRFDTAYAQIWPQGWSFFADAPILPDFAPYRADAQGDLAPVLAPRMSARNAGGVVQSGSVWYDEWDALVENLPAADFVSCPAFPAASCVPARTAQSTDDFQPALFCGRYTVVEVTPQPAHWPAVPVGRRRLVAEIDLGCPR